jgi:polyhydroxybutyrate depolymerase
MFASIYSYAQYDSIPYGSYDRTFLLHLPIGYTGASDIPLIVAMHGGFGNAYNIENQSQLSAKADAENFIVVYPEGVRGGTLNISSWNAGWCCGYASNSNVDDVGFIDALLDTLINLYSIDTNRIYATGMSNGGFMSYRLACELSDRIAAIAPVAASMSMVSCYPVRPVPVIDFHSYLDTNVPYYGGIGSGPSNHYNPPIDSVLNAWSTNNNCMTSNDTIANNAQYSLIKWSNCDCNTEIYYYLTEDGGHSWHGGNQTITGDPVSTYVIATDEMWSFFQQHTLNCNTVSSVNNNLYKKRVNLHPNPINETFTIVTPDNHILLEVTIYDVFGQKLIEKQNQTTIECGRLPTGTYIVEISIDGKSTNERIVKI